MQACEERWRHSSCKQSRECSCKAGPNIGGDERPQGHPREARTVTVLSTPTSVKANMTGLAVSSAASLYGSLQTQSFVNTA